MCYVFISCFLRLNHVSDQHFLQSTPVVLRVQNLPQPSAQALNQELIEISADIRGAGLCAYFGNAHNKLRLSDKRGPRGLCAEKKGAIKERCFCKTFCLIWAFGQMLYGLVHPHIKLALIKKGSVVPFSRDVCSAKTFIPNESARGTVFNAINGLLKAWLQNYLTWNGPFCWAVLAFKVLAIKGRSPK